MALIYDTEWDIETKEYLCSSWIDEKNGRLYATTSLGSASDVITKHKYLCGHNFKGDLKRHVMWGIKPHKEFQIIDTLLLARALYSLLPEKNLKAMARMEGYDLVDQHHVKDPKQLMRYCSEDTFSTAQLKRIYLERFEEQGLFSHEAMKQNFLFSRSFMMLELAGMRLDLPFLLDEHARLDKKIRKGVKLFKDPLLITNDPMFLEELIRTYPKRILDEYIAERDGSYNTRAECVDMLPDPPAWLTALQEARADQTYQTLYVDNLLEYGAYVDPEFNILMTRTHRRSTRPTIQNWPGPARRAVISRFPKGKIIEADMKNLEARVFGWQAGCQTFVDDMVEYGYLGVAKRTLGTVDITDKTDPRYRTIKSTVLGVTYCMSEWLFAYREWQESKGKMRLRSAREVARDTYGPFFGTYPEIKADMNRRMEYVLEHGYTDSWCGVHMPVPLFDEELLYAKGFDSKRIGKYYEKLKHFGVNWPTQGFASYVTGCALNDLIDKIVKHYMKGDYGAYAVYCWQSRTFPSGRSKLDQIPVVIGEVHDSLVVDTPEAEEKTVTRFIREAMTFATSLRILAPTLPHNLLDVDIISEQYWKKG